MICNIFIVFFGIFSMSVNEIIKIFESPLWKQSNLLILLNLGLNFINNLQVSVLLSFIFLQIQFKVKLFQLPMLNKEIMCRQLKIVHKLRFFPSVLFELLHAKNLLKPIVGLLLANLDIGINSKRIELFHIGITLKCLDKSSSYFLRFLFVFLLSHRYDLFNIVIDVICLQSEYFSFAHLRDFRVIYVG
jgi:hypothetical protein